MRLKPRITITLSPEQIRILQQYGSRNMSAWIGEIIEQWYLYNVSEADRLQNKLKWLELKKKEVEDDIRFLQEKVDKLEDEEKK